MEIKYQIDTTNVDSHLIRIQGEFNAPWADPILEMPVWTPGSYKIRDYSKHVQNLNAKTNNKVLEVYKISKNQWKVKSSKSNKIVFNYDVYGFDFSVRTTYLGDKYGLLTPASLFFYCTDGNENTKNWKYSLKINSKEDWFLFTSLKKEGDEYFSDDFDELVDSPIALADPFACETLTYLIDNGNGKEIACTIALIGIKGNQDIEAFRENMIKLQNKSIEMFGELPYDRYLWILYVVESGSGGLEHKNSNFSIIPRWHFKGDEKNFTKLMGLEAHEHFHSYNIKRIRPRQLGPFDYTKEVYTTLLWVAEGLTSYYDNIFLPRCGIITEDNYWQIIADDIKKLHKTEGRKITSLSEASFDAWIKYYQRHRDLYNFYVSYYLKGSIVGLMLDLEIRNQTNWQYSLDTFFSSMYHQYRKNPETGYSEYNFRYLMQKYTNTDLEEFWKKYIEGTEELNINDYLTIIGLELKTEVEEQVYIGWELNNSKKKVSSVRADSPALKGGVYTGDEILAINGYKVSSKTYNTIVKNLKPGEIITVHLFRDGFMREKNIKLGDPKASKYTIEMIKNPTDEQIMRYKLFLHQKTDD